MTWKRLFAGGAGAAILLGGILALNNCTVVDCSKTPNDPQCQKSDSGPTGDSAPSETGPSDGAAMDGSDSGGTCPAIPAIVYFDNPQGTGTCDKCMAGKCCSEVTTCFSDKGEAGSDTCADFDDCLSACQGLDGGAFNTCVDACKQSHPNSISKWTAYANCMTNKCGNECM